jgi:hypothetical protein
LRYDPNQYPPLPDFEKDINGRRIAFEGNSCIRPAECKLPWTQEYIEEWVRCKEDIFYFAERYHHILNIDTGLQKIVLRDYQEEMIQNFQDHRFNIVLSSRQSGKSTSFEIFVLHHILFQADKRVAILANKASSSCDILKKIKQAFMLLPKWLQQGVEVWNNGSITLENGCEIFASSTSSSAIRGRAVSLLIIDELAFVPRGIFDDFFASSYPTISSGQDSRIIFVSTPCGLNHFYKFWCDAEEKKNKFHQYRVDWWQVPGRDEKWRTETIANIGMVKFNQEFGNEFLGSADTLIEAHVVRSLKHSDQFEFSDIHEKVQQSLHQCLYVYEEAKKDRLYSMGIDSSKMTKDHAGDALGIQVVDITELPYRQVATFYAKSAMSYLQIPGIAYEIGKYYNWAYAFIENNEIGQEVANILNYDYEYETMFWEKADLPGFRTTRKTKRVGLQNLKMLIENYKLKVIDFETIFQLSTFIRVKDSYTAEPGYKDDLVMALVACIFFLQRKEFGNFENPREFFEKVLEVKETAAENDVPAFGFIEDGTLTLGKVGDDGFRNVEDFF